MNVASLSKLSAFVVWAIALWAVPEAGWAQKNAAPTTSAATRPPRVVILKSADSGAYQQVSAGFVSVANALTDVVVLPESGNNDALLKKIVEIRPSLVLALGANAATVAKRTFTQFPVLFALVPGYESHNLEAPNITGIAFTTSLQAGMTALRAFSKKATRLGLIYNPEHSSDVASQIESTIKPWGWSVFRVELTDPTQTSRALQATRNKVDAFWMLADATTTSAPVIQATVAHARTHRLPLVGASGGQVKNGALFSITPSFIALGEQAGRLANRIIHEKVDPSAIAVSQSEVQELSVNLTTLKRMTSMCDVGLEGYRIAAEGGHLLKVYP